MNEPGLAMAKAVVARPAATRPIVRPGLAQREGPASAMGFEER